jgi:hypothetical protein
MTPYDISQLADELYCAGTLGRHLCTPLLRLLAAGEPVSIERLTRAMGRTPAQVTRALQMLPSIEYDAVGNIVGALREQPTLFYSRTFAHSALACGSMVLSIFMVSRFSPCGRKMRHK